MERQLYRLIFQRIHPNNGHPFGDCWIDADSTISLGHRKPGLYNLNYAGNIQHLDIGLEGLALWNNSRERSLFAHIVEKTDILRMLPTENTASAKWNRGHVAIMAKGGAAVLAAKSSFATGAGLVTPRTQIGVEWAYRTTTEVILATPEALNPKSMMPWSLDQRGLDNKTVY